ncbi:MAG: hypothetical protein IJH79_05995 [Lentisphaeria bacterium]|nr:hypothetical protein [Lentisphaeria bacterium]
MLDLSKEFLAKGDMLVCFGDSLTFADPGYVSILREKLSGNTVINAGKGGDKTVTALMRFQKDVLDLKPNALSIFFGVNDAVIGHGRWANEPMLSPEAYRSNIVWMIHTARLSGISKVSVAAPFAEPEGEYFLEDGDCFAAYCLAARKAADEMNARIVPLDSMFRNEWRKHPGHTGLLLTRDGVHPTPEGNRLIAETFLSAWRMK